MSLKSEAKGRVIAGILAGGGSRRFGSDKACAVYEGKSLLEWTIHNASEITDNINILTKKPEAYNFAGCRIIEDLLEVSTPISGIISIMPYVSDWLLLLACDIPFFEKKVLDFLWEKRDSEKATVIHVNGKFQPFLGLYPKSVLPYWKEAFAQEEYHLQGVIEGMPKIVIQQSDLMFAGISLQSFLNINTTADLELIGI
ncbi:MAG: molybdenum cofactor guanylyltransferase [Spirochaetales bacterium]|nr:molybdenum cofactor guanylyltransferase [Spirochaetales bacterium]